MEYAVILFMLKKKRKPFRTIDQGLKNLFTSKASNEEASQPLHSPTHRENHKVRRKSAAFDECGSTFNLRPFY